VSRIRKEFDETNRIVVVTDSFLPLSQINSSDTIFRYSKSHHLGVSDNTGLEAEPFVDFFLMGKAKKIYSTSIYDWGSGFSQIAAELSGVPHLQIPFPQILGLSSS
jgi:hypothetical protein